MGQATVLFICIGNTCRSPMAEAMARALGRGGVRALSAGLAATGRVAPETLATLDALGYSGEGLSSKGLSRIPLDEVDLVVSLIGPPGVRWIPRGMPMDTLVWNLPDPWGEDEETYMAVGRRIEGLVRDLVDELSVRRP